MRKVYEGIVVIMLVLLFGLGLPPAQPEAALAQTQARPNILFILSDDQPAETLGAMPKTKQALDGISFTNAYATTPLCCPSRASLLTGKYSHNHQVWLNTAPSAEPGFRELGEDQKTIAVALQNAGYSTAYIGKYLNAYEGTYVPPGWDRWIAPVTTYSHDPVDERYKLNEDGDIKTYYRAQAGDETDLYGQRAKAFIESNDGPWFVVVAPHDPHRPYRAAERNRGIHSPSLPGVPSFNEQDVSDKPGWIRNIPRFTADEVQALREANARRLDSLKDVDDLVGSLNEKLTELGEENTYVIFASDNGFHRGEHRLKNKGTAYDESAKIPLLVRGPGISQGTSEKLVANIDLAPTFAELAETSMPNADGRSLLPLLSGDAPWRDALLLEYRTTGNPPPTWWAIRRGRWKYVKLESGTTELYDLSEDPYELHNDYRDANVADPALIADLESRLDALKRCKEDGCRVAEDAP